MNRELLAKYCLHGKGKVTKAILHKDGFKFGYYTGRYETQQGHLYYYCYDYGYCVLGKDKMLIVKLQPYVQNYLDNIM
ncbi:hypothetical protein [Catalinimonas alkaloidigena]|uniref:hypothetical protein n=1 Tax=Catalinimonas alkaloidigena TaxID=1075417 RepID=UPI002405903C|nr:hypothetical protein [Catalinimonas alkaloidigena]